MDALDRAVLDAAHRIYGYPVTDIEMIEFHLLKRKCREVLEFASQATGDSPEYTGLQCFPAGPEV